MSPFTRKPSQKQSAIIELGREKELFTLADAVKAIGGDIYCNKNKHVGAVLSNMVKTGLLDRVKPGVFKIRSMDTPITPRCPQQDLSGFQLS